MSQLQQALESRSFELIYEKRCRQLEVVCDTEQLRRSRLYTLMLEQANHDLHTQLAQEEGRIDDLERINQRLQKDLEIHQTEIESVHADLRVKSREIETLKVKEQANTANIQRKLTAGEGEPGVFERSHNGLDEALNGKAYPCARAVLPETGGRPSTVSSRIASVFACGEAFFTAAAEYTASGARDRETLYPESACQRE